MSGSSGKRKKGGGQPVFHQSQSIALTTHIGEDEDRPSVKKRTVYTAEPDVDSFEEDTNTLARAAQLDGFTYLLGESISLNDYDINGSDSIGGIHVQVSNPRKYYNSTNDPMKVWRTFREDYLLQLIRLEGSGGIAGGLCNACAQDGSVAQFRCHDDDCLGLGLLCENCICTTHRHHPLHWVEQWTGSYFRHISLTDFGVAVTLGHTSGGVCPNPLGTVSNFTVLHTNGVHILNVGFCGCRSDVTFRDLALSSSWWPATPTHPHTAVTFPLLRFAHAMNCNGKLPTWDLWRSLCDLTEERTGASTPNCYRVLLRCLRQWRHVKLCRDAGRAHDGTGIAGTADGELALQCPACPQPDKNLPSDYATRPNAWIYTTYLANDANFRLRNENVSTEERDPPLGDGFAYFTPRKPYFRWLAKHATQEETPNCSGFQAYHLANIKNSKGLRVSGVTGVCCARHGCLRPNGLGDLNKGEKFCSVDYVHASACRHDPEVKKLTSYDIACIWAVNWFKRVKDLPAPVQFLNPETMRFAIPKLHFWSHLPEDHAQFSLNLLPFVGRTAAEIIEWLWSQSNRAASQTKKMGPGARADTLDDIFNNINRRTIEAFERVFASRMIEAIKNSPIHTENFEKFDAGLADTFGREVLDLWLQEIKTWEADFTQPCPYEGPAATQMTITEIRIQLEKEEQANLASNPASIVQESTASSMLTLGLEIESLQRSLAWEVKARSSGATYQQLNIERRRTDILRRIKKFRGLQQIYMPHVLEFLSPEQVERFNAPPDIIPPEEIKLIMPSELTSSQREMVRACKAGIADMEMRLREAECWESLEALRSGLRTRSASVRFQVQNVSGQTAVTRAEGIQRRVLVNINLAKLQYRWARNALYRLKGHGEWENQLRVLDEKHVQGLNERMLTAQEEAESNDIRERGLLFLGQTGAAAANALAAQGEGHREVSWIWFSFPKGVSAAMMIGDDAFKNNLKREWCKARARMLRWREEIELLTEEMRRVVAFDRWKANWWDQRGSGRPNASQDVVEGLQAFAFASSARLREEANRLESAWLPLVSAGRDILDNVPAGQSVDYSLNIEDYDDDPDEDDTLVDED